MSSTLPTMDRFPLDTRKRGNRRSTRLLPLCGFLLLTTGACADSSIPVPSTVPSPSSTVDGPSPAATAPTIESASDPATPRYTVACGPLEPTRCREDAARAVKANETHAGKRVMSIRFTTDCGSFFLRFEDGSGVGAQIDCIHRPSASG